MSELPFGHRRHTVWGVIGVEAGFCLGELDHRRWVDDGLRPLGTWSGGKPDDRTFYCGWSLGELV